LLSIAAQYRVFGAAHPHERLGAQTFRTYVNDIAGTKILRRVRQLGFNDEQPLDVRRYLQEVLELNALSRGKKKEIVAVFPEGETAASRTRKKWGER